MDGGPVASGLDTYAARNSASFADCADTRFGTPTPITFGGDVIVHDARPLPSSKDRCKNGGWQSYGVFTNQGDRISFVATGSKNPPTGP